MAKTMKRGAAEASLENLRKIFTVPEKDLSTLAQIEKEISKNLLGFLRRRMVTGEVEPQDMEKDFLETILPDDPVFVSTQADFLLRKVVDQSVLTSSPSFIGHMTSALPYFMLPLAKIMIALNQNLVKIETSKAFTPLERQVIGILHRLIYDFQDSFYQENLHNHERALGTFSSGGTLANITALWAARNQMLGPQGTFHGIAQEGLAAALKHYNLEGLAILTSKRYHYSLTKTADVLGIGRKYLVPVDTDSNNKISITALEKELSYLQDSRIGILSVIGIAGTTETGNVDPLDKISRICREIKCHFHVDAAWGGPTLFSKRYAQLLKGIESADSVTIDCHKQLYVPIGAAVTLFRNETSISTIEHHAQYIIRKGSRDLGKHTIEGSRPGMAMLVHSSLRIIGKKGFELLINLGIGKAVQFAKMIKASDDFELISEPELNLLTYRYVPEFVRDALNTVSKPKQFALNQLINQLTIDIQKTQRAHGKTFVSRTSFEVQKYNQQMLTVFRIVTANPLTTRQILEQVLIEQREIAGYFLKNMKYEISLKRIISD